jgi:hypothetical protein
VDAFYYRMLIVLTEPHPVFVERYDNLRKAMDENIRFVKQLISFPQGSLELQHKALAEIRERLGSITSLIATTQGKLDREFQQIDPPTMGNR